MAATAPRFSTRPIYEGTRIPHPIPTVLTTSDEVLATGDVMTVNFGPNHPSTHGVLRLIVDLYGEDVTGLAAVIGYLHTGIEKQCENKTYWQAITLVTRMDYLASYFNIHAYTSAVEKLLGLEVPDRAQYIRVIMSELNRLTSHLVWLGTSGLELGAITTPVAPVACISHRRERACRRRRWPAGTPPRQIR